MRKKCSLRKESTGRLGQAREGDEVLLKLESGGGMVHARPANFPTADRIRHAGWLPTIPVDKVAASGGYMMACIADKNRICTF